MDKPPFYDHDIEDEPPSYKETSESYRQMYTLPPLSACGFIRENHVPLSDREIRLQRNENALNRVSANSVYPKYKRRLEKDLAYKKDEQLEKNVVDKKKNHWWSKLFNI